MFTGIVQGTGTVAEIKDHYDIRTLTIEFPKKLVEGLQVGASVAIDGVCLTVTKHKGVRVSFDVITETLEKTTLGTLTAEGSVHLERAARYGDEIGGHMVSGHVTATGTIAAIDDQKEQRTLIVACPKEIMRYILPKGFVSIDGASLTIGNTDPEGHFHLHLIPETLRVCHFSQKQVGDAVNIELDPMTQAVVATVERVLETTHV